MAPALTSPVVEDLLFDWRTNGVEAVLPGLTCTRILGEMEVSFDFGAPGRSTLFFGVKVANRGTSSSDSGNDPFVDRFADWMLWGTCSALSDTAGGVQKTCVIDVKSQRKIPRSEQSLFFFFRPDPASAGLIRVAVGASALVLLP